MISGNNNAAYNKRLQVTLEPRGGSNAPEPPR
jgi:anti-sigma-K factor RskA